MHHKFIIAGLLSLLWINARGQDFEHIGPKTMPVKEAVEVPAGPVSVAPAANAKLMDSLKALVLVSDPKKVVTGGIAKIRGVQVRDIPLLDTPQFRKRVGPYLGKPVTGQSLDELMRVIVLYYRQIGRPVVEVVLPEQDVTSGILQLVVVEAKIGKIKAEGGRWFNAEDLKSDLLTKSGEVIESKKILADLDWLNRNPFRTVDLVYTKGDEFGKTDLILRQKDRFPVRFYAGYEDSGTPLTGEDRWLAGFNWGNAFFQNGQLNYQFTASSDLQKLSAHSMVYTQPLPWRHVLTIFGSYGETKANIGPLFNLQGWSWQTSMRYEVPLETIGPWKHSLLGGFDFKQTNNNLAFGGQQVFGAQTDVAQFVAAYVGHAPDDFGENSFRMQLFFNPGGMTDGDRTPNYQAQRFRADPEYVYGNIEFSRISKLPLDFSLFNKITWQLSDSNLLASEQLGLGGYATVRGYDEREVNTDEGWILNNELRTPPISPGQWIGFANANDQLQFLVFWDYAVGNNHFLQPGEKSSIGLSGVGPGLRYVVGPYLSVRADYGFQLVNSGFNTRNDGRWHLGIVFSY